MSMKNLVDCKKLHNIMTLATEQKNFFFNDTIVYKELYCLFSVSVVNEEIPSLHLKKGQKVVTSPMTDNQDEYCCCKVYSTFDVDVDSGLFLPIISLVNEFTKQILLSGIPVSLTDSHGMMEKIMLQVWEFEEVIQSDNGIKIELQNPVSWKSIMEKRISWNNYDSFAQAETLLRNGVVTMDNVTLPHVHTENIEHFRKAGLSKEVIFDW